MLPLQLHLEGVAVKDALWFSLPGPLPGIVIPVPQIPGISIRMFPTTTKRRPRPKSTPDFDNVIINLFELAWLGRGVGILESVIYGNLQYLGDIKAWLNLTALPLGL